MRLVVILTVFSSIILTGCRSFTPEYRQSYDQTESILYIAQDLALSKYLVPHSNGTIIYSIAHAHWGGTPELPSQTGDHEDGMLVASVTRLAFIEKQNLVVGIGQIPSGKSTEFPPLPRYFAVNTKGGNPTFAHTLAELQKLVPSIAELKECQLVETADIFVRIARRAKREDPYSKK